MNRVREFVSLLFVFQCFFTLAEPLCDYPPQFNQHGIFSNESFPDCPGSQFVAAPFYVVKTNAQIRRITWYGFWHGSPESSARAASQITKFQVRVYPDINGSPATNAMFEQIIDAKVQSAGESMKLTKAPGYAGNPVFRYEADLPGPITLNSAPYWLAISATHPTTDQWLWCRSSDISPGLVYGNTAKENWKRLTARQQTAFRLD